MSAQCGGAVISVAITPNGSRIVAGAVDRRLYIFDETAQLVEEPIELDNEVWAVATSDGGDLIAAGTASKHPSDGTLYAFEPGGRRVLRQELGAPVWGVSLSSSGDLIAASTWRGDFFAFRRHGRAFQEQVREHLNDAEAGCYGVVVLDEQRVAVALYDAGLLLIDCNTGSTELTPIKTGLYNLAYASSSSTIFAGTSEGEVVGFEVRGLELVRTHCSAVSKRPVSAITTDLTGNVIVAGSFDGSVTCLGRNTGELWRDDVGAEVWSSAASLDASTIVIGAGNGYVHVLDNASNTGMLRELEAALAHLTRSPDLLPEHIVSLALAAGAHSLLIDMITKMASEATFAERGQLRGILGRIVDHSLPGHNSDILYRASRLHATLGGEAEAIRLCQALASDPNYQARALKFAGECFRELQLPSAADCCFRRAIERTVNHQQIRLIYDIGRHCEERGDLAGARDHYELLLSWDIGYRDTQRRLDLLRRRNPDAAAYQENLGYTGLTVSMLGPDVPRGEEVDPILQPVLEARLVELKLPVGERSSLFNAVRVMDDLKVFQGRRLQPLGYDATAYMRYEYSPPEDTAKKHLEMANLLKALSGHHVSASLDIGAATCRYPEFLATLGVDLSVGIDIGADGFLHMRERGIQFDSFVQGDGRHLPFGSDSFDLASCMMGTLNHLTPDARLTLLKEARRVLRSGGMMACGLWNTDCSYQSFLGMYDAIEKLELRSRPLTPESFVECAEAAGFDGVESQAFCCFPDQIIYDLGLEVMDADALRNLCDFDLAVRARTDPAGSQMFLGIMIKR